MKILKLIIKDLIILHFQDRSDNLNFLNDLLSLFANQIKEGQLQFYFLFDKDKWFYKGKNWTGG